MNKEKELIMQFGNLTFLFSIVISATYRMKKGLDTDDIFSVYCLYCVGDYVIKYKKSGKKRYIAIAALSFVNAILLMLIHNKKQNKCC
ncbi:DUF6442 family protein [Lachnospiraceae bacterium 46-61]